MPLPDKIFTNGRRCPFSLLEVDYLERFIPRDVGSDLALKGREACGQLSVVPFVSES